MNKKKKSYAKKNLEFYFAVFPSEGKMNLQLEETKQNITEEEN